MDQQSSLSLDILKKANHSLKLALSPPPANDRERDGALQRFEYTVELSWRLIRKFLLSQGRADVSASPKPLIRQASIEGWIQDVEGWLSLIEARNLTSHSYKDEIAKKVFSEAHKLPPLVDHLIQKLSLVK